MPFLYFSFHVDTMLLGIPAQAVIELTHSPEVSRVPGAPDHVRGLINLRGKLAIAVDLRRRMGLVSTGLEADDQLIGLLVDGVNEIFSLDGNDFVPSPIDLGSQNRTLVTGAYRLPNGLLHILNTVHILNIEAEKP
jgi:purine-binding chemotaxis protein CheW